MWRKLLLVKKLGAAGSPPASCVTAPVSFLLEGCPVPPCCAFHQLLHRDWNLPKPTPDPCQEFSKDLLAILRSHGGLHEREAQGTAVPEAQSGYPGCRGGWEEEAKQKLSLFLESCFARVSPSARRVLLWEERSFRSFQSCECSFREGKSLRLIRT